MKDLVSQMQKSNINSNNIFNNPKPITGQPCWVSSIIQAVRQQSLLKTMRVCRRQKTTTPHVRFLTRVWETAALWTAPQQSQTTIHGHLESKARLRHRVNLSKLISIAVQKLHPHSLHHKRTHAQTQGARQHSIYLCFVLTMLAIPG